MRCRTPYSAALLFALLLLLPLALLIGLQGRQWWLQQTAKERMEQSALHTLWLQPQALQWAKPGRELRLHGKLFDVHSIKSTAGALEVTGLYDEEEKAIEDLLAVGQQDKTALIRLLALTQLLVAAGLPLLLLLFFSRSLSFSAPPVPALCARAYRPLKPPPDGPLATSL